MASSPPRAIHREQPEVVLEEVGVAVDRVRPWKTFRLPIMWKTT